MLVVEVQEDWFWEFVNEVLLGYWEEIDGEDKARGVEGEVELEEETILGGKGICCVSYNHGK